MQYIFHPGLTVPASADISVRESGRREPLFILAALHPNGDYWHVYQIQQTGGILQMAGWASGRKGHGSSRGTTTMARLKESARSAYLTNDEVIAEYLAAALEEADTDAFLAATGNAAVARRPCAAADRER